LICNLKTEVDFSCLTKRTLDATIVVDFVPRKVDLRCKKTKSTFWKAKAKKPEKMSSFAAGAGLRL
jgi:hypothetical protein